MWKTVVFGLVAMLAVVQPSFGLEPSAGVSYGNNIWGNTLGLSLDAPLSRHLVWQFSYGTGQMAFDTQGDEKFPFVGDPPGDDHRVSLDLKQMVCMGISYRRNEVSGVQLLNEFGGGAAHVFVGLRSEFESQDGLTTFRGERDYSRYGVFFTANVLDFEVGVGGDVVFSLGIRSMLVWLDSPQELHYTDGAGRIATKTARAEHGDTLYYPYPELFLIAKYRF
jgi:hypothetical protein